MEPKEIIGALEKEEGWKGWKKENASSFLAHIFLMEDEKSKESLQVGYYNEAKDNMVVFLMKDGSFERSEEMLIFKKENAKISELDMSRVKMGFEESSSIASKIKEENYRVEDLKRKIMILQMLDGTPMFNNTFITASFKIMNVRINAETKEVVSHMLKSIMDLGKIEGDV